MSSLFSKSITLRKEQKITDEEFSQLRDFIYDQCGIYIADNRKYLTRLSGLLIQSLKKKSIENN
jgi:chemotaxis protein methyltransferase CheR